MAGPVGALPIPVLPSPPRRCGLHAAGRLDRLQAEREKRGEDERQRDAGNAGRPAVAVEDLAEHGAADEPPEEIAGEIDPLAEPRSMVAARLTNPVAVAWARNVPMPTSASPASTAPRLGTTSSTSPAPAMPSENQHVGRVPRRFTALPASSVVTIDGTNTK